MTQVAKHKLLYCQGISLKQLRVIGFKNPYAFIYKMRQDGFQIKTIEAGCGTLYILKHTTSQRTLEDSFWRVFRWVMALSALTFTALSIF